MAQLASNLMRLVCNFIFITFMCNVRIKILHSQATIVKFVLKCWSSVPTLVNWCEVILSPLAIAHSSMKLRKHYTGFAPRRHPHARNDLSQKVRWRLFDYSCNRDKLSVYKSSHWPETAFWKLPGQILYKIIQQYVLKRSNENLMLAEILLCTSKFSYLPAAW